MTAGDANDRVTLDAGQARGFLTDLFAAAGVDDDAAALVADGLVEADLQGVGSHGMLQAPTYLRRLRAGTIAGKSTLKLVHSSAAVTVYDAGVALGHAVASKVMDHAVGSARTHGLAAVAVRTATHFGVAGRHARVAADAGVIGIVMCNTRPMLAAPEGSRAVVGNNPLAIAIPVAGREPIVFDMSMSAVAMGKIRLAAQRGEAIPLDWALDPDGQPTTDAAAALNGVLLPAAGAKGYGLALMVDFFCALSGGSALGELTSMYADPGSPSDCSWFFLAIDPAHFGLAQPYCERMAYLARSVVAAAGEGSLPGDRKLEAERQAGGRIVEPRSLAEDLERLSVEFGSPTRLLAAD
jgi:LDH2 family malate/lactate/ureidoglycolate dehydrogenase